MQMITCRLGRILTFCFFVLLFSHSSCRWFSHLIVQLTQYNFFWFDLVYSMFDLSIKVDRTLENVTIKQTGQIDSLLLA